MNHIKTIKYLLLIHVIFFITFGCSDTQKVAISNSQFKNHHKLEDRNVHIYGKIDDGINYFVQVFYRANSDKSQCINWNSGWGLFNRNSFEYKIEKYEYYPDVEGGNHYLKIPLREIEPDSFCKFEPDIIKLCVLKTGDRKRYANQTCHYWFQPDNRDYPSYKTLDIECLMYSRRIECYQGDASKRDSIQTPLVYNSKYEVNIKLFSAKEKPYVQ